MSAPDSLYLLKEGQQSGPHTHAELRALLDSGHASHGDHVWAEGWPDWVTLGSVPGMVPAPEAASSAAFDLPPERGFGALILDALAYPFRGDGFLILALGTILFTVLDFVGMFSWIITAAAWGYLLLMLQHVLHGTAMGEDRVPNWPDFDGFGELLGKTFQWIGVLVACFGPGIFLLVTARDNEVRMTAGAAALLLGLLFGPMALLSVGMHDTLSGLHPGLIVRSIFRAPGHYVAMLLVFVALACLQVLAGQLSDRVPVAGIVIDKLDELWTAVFVARVLGAFYFVNRRTLSWFGE